MFPDWLSVFYDYNKNKHIKKNLAGNFESLADKVTDNFEKCKLEDFRELLHAYVDIFTKNIYETHINAYKNWKRLINDTNIAFLLAIKNHELLSPTAEAILIKLQHMIDEDIQNGF